MYGIHRNSKTALSYNLVMAKSVMLPSELNSAITCLLLKLGTVTQLEGKYKQDGDCVKLLCGSQLMAAKKKPLLVQGKVSPSIRPSKTGG